jgi:hypothetical protein
VIYYGGDPGGSGRPRAIGAPAKKADAAVPRYRYRKDPRRLAHAGLFNWLTLDEKRMLDPHNRQSASRGLGRLRVHPALTKAVGD